MNCVKNIIDNNNIEHQLYNIGKAFIDNDKTTKKSINKTFQTAEELEKYRYHNLVKIGAEVENSELTKNNRATLVGAYLVTMKTLSKDIA